MRALCSRRERPIASKAYAEVSFYVMIVRRERRLPIDMIKRGAYKHIYYLKHYPRRVAGKMEKPVCQS